MVESTRRRIISITEENYQALKRIGYAGDSFNRVLTALLKRNKMLLRNDPWIGGPPGLSVKDVQVEALGGHDT